MTIESIRYTTANDPILIGAVGVGDDSSVDYLGRDGVDAYIIDSNFVAPGGQANIVDSGDNVIRLVGGLDIESSQILTLANGVSALNLTLSNGSTISVSNGSAFTFEVGGQNNGVESVVQTFEQLATETLGYAEVPSPGASDVGGPVTIPPVDPAPEPIPEPANLSWDIDGNGILGNGQGTMIEGGVSVWGYFSDADQVRADNDSEAEVHFALNIAAEPGEPAQEVAVNIQIINFSVGDRLDVSNIVEGIGTGETPVVTGTSFDEEDGLFGFTLAPMDPEDAQDLVYDPANYFPAWNVELPDIAPALVQELDDLGEGDLTAGLTAALGTDDFWLVL